MGTLCHSWMMLDVYAPKYGNLIGVECRPITILMFHDTSCKPTKSLVYCQIYGIIWAKTTSYHIFHLPETYGLLPLTIAHIYAIIQ